MALTAFTPVRCHGPYAQNDAHAIAIMRQMVARLERPQQLQLRSAQEPLYPADDLYGVVSADVRKPYDVREVIARIATEASSKNSNSSTAPHSCAGLRIFTACPSGSSRTTASCSANLH